MKTHVFVIAAFIIMTVAINGVMAEWSAPVPVTELNTQYAEFGPFLSYDGLSLYFSRANIPGSFYFHRIYQATRSTPSGPFTQVSQISTLNSSDGHILDPWVSPDNLRMYYQTTETGISKIRYTSRASTSAPWMPGNEVSQIDIYGNVISMRLSSDECTALFATLNNGTWLTYMATRPNRYSTFDNIATVAAINPGAADPFLMPDGLSAYFVGNGGLNKITRPTTNDVFGSATIIPGFDNIRFPTLSADGMTLYFTKEYFDQNNKLIDDIYVSHYIPEPATMALLGLGGLLIRKRT